MATRPSDLHVHNKINAAVEIYDYCIDIAKKNLEEKFGRPSNYYEGEKKLITAIADTVFHTTVTSSDIEEYAIKKSSMIERVKIE